MYLYKWTSNNNNVTIYIDNLGTKIIEPRMRSLEPYDQAKNMLIYRHLIPEGYKTITRSDILAVQAYGSSEHLLLIESEL